MTRPPQLRPHETLGPSHGLHPVRGQSDAARMAFDAREVQRSGRSTEACNSHSTSDASAHWLLSVKNVDVGHLRDPTVKAEAYALAQTILRRLIHHEAHRPTRDILRALLRW